MCQVRSCKGVVDQRRKRQEGGRRTYNVERWNGKHAAVCTEEVHEAMVPSNAAVKRRLVAREAAGVEPAEGVHLVDEDALPENLRNPLDETQGRGKAGEG